MLKDDQYTLIRDLAKKVKEISLEPAQDALIRLWQQKNALVKVRPLVLCTPPEPAWQEMMPSEGLTCQDPMLRMLERDLRMRIYRHEHFEDDRPIVDTVYVPLVKTVSA